MDAITPDAVTPVVAASAAGSDGVNRAAPAGRADAKLHFEGVTRHYGSREAVRGLTLSVAPGEVVCLLGASGCGKSTSLRIAAGVERQTAGRGVIDGQEVAGPDRFMPPEARNVGLMFQDYALFPHMSVFDNVAFGLSDLTRGERRRRVMEALERVHMEAFAERYPSDLSGGEQQRVALARALAPRPGVLLMDEPFSGLDVPKRDRIRDETWSLLKDTGTATLLVTHDPKEAMRMADRIALMRAGRLVQLDAPDAIYNAPVDAEAASFFSDLNIFRSTVLQGVAATPFGSVAVAGQPDGTSVEIMARPHAIDVVPAEARGQNGAVAAVVRRSILLGPESLIEAALAPSETIPAGANDPVTVRAMVPGTVLPAPGVSLGLRLDPAAMFVFPGPRG
ncbi:MAG: ABC transporter ATP-binding protein [Alphaproteobacteria bacterium]